MNYEEAEQLKESLLFDFVFVKKPIIRRGFSEMKSYESLKQDLHEFVNGLAIVKNHEGSYTVKMYTEGNISHKEILKFLGVKASDLEIDEIGPITILGHPLQPGDSIGHYKVPVGTFACYVRDEAGHIYVLSNNHVLANFNRAGPDEAILHPGQKDGGKFPTNTVATLKKFIPVKFGEADNFLDCGIATCINQNVQCNEIAGVGTIKGTIDADFDMEVFKYGRTTKRSDGKIISTNATIKVDYGGSFIYKNIATFNNQIEIKSTVLGKPFASTGDSGSLIIHNQPYMAVALLFAGSRNGTAFANPINNVLNALSVEIL